MPSHSGEDARLSSYVKAPIANFTQMWDRPPGESPSSLGQRPAVPRNPRYATLDVWRGVACLSVAVFHSTYYLTDVAPGVQTWITAVFQRLWIGVPLFFVISGYCIAAAADGLRRRDGRVTTYFWRRFRRIFPPYWICVALSLCIVLLGEALWPGIFSDATHGINPRLRALSWLGNLTLTETWAPHVFGGGEQLFLGHAWTLCYEEQFYAVVGMLLLIGRKQLFRNAAIITTVTAVTMTTASYLGLPVDGTFLDGRFLYFGAGVLVYWALIHGTSEQRRYAAITLVAPLTVFITPVARVIHAHELWQSSLAVSMTFALVLLALHRFDDRMIENRWLAPLRWCGERCYSIYLIHWPFVKLVSHGASELGVRGFWPTVLVSLPLSVTAAVAAGALFHQHVERRFLNTTSLAHSKPALTVALSA